MGFCSIKFLKIYTIIFTIRVNTGNSSHFFFLNCDVDINLSFFICSLEVSLRLDSCQNKKHAYLFLSPSWPAVDLFLEECIIVK